MGQQEEPIPVNPGEKFQNHALNYEHTPACTRNSRTKKEFAGSERVRGVTGEPVGEDPEG
jgi:hypothetical protein